ncbi:hypothetical protein ACJX0J_009618, partial [Zea mays]
FIKENNISGAYRAHSHYVMTGGTRHNNKITTSIRTYQAHSHFVMTGGTRYNNQITTSIESEIGEWTLGLAEAILFDIVGERIFWKINRFFFFFYSDGFDTDMSSTKLALKTPLFVLEDDSLEVLEDLTR